MMNFARFAVALQLMQLLENAIMVGSALNVQ